jgi:hypothetical protein
MFAEHPWRKSSMILCAMLAAIAFYGDMRPARAAESTADEAVAKQKIYQSQAWQQAMAGLNEWLSVQVIYDQREVPRLKRELVARLDKMSAAELGNYLADLQQKLAILSSPEAIAARSYIGYNLSVASNAYAAKIRRGLPDVLNMNALQVKQALYNLQQEQAATKASQAAFDSQREAQVKLVQQWTQQTANAQAAAAAQMNSAPSGGGYVPPAIPTNPMPTYNPAPIYWGWPW